VRHRLITLVVVVTLGAQVLLGACPNVAHAAPSPVPTGDVNSELPWHAVTVDSQGKLLAWYRPQQHLGYDKVLRLGWNFIEHKVPDQSGTNLKTYLVNSVFDSGTLQGVYWQSNPAMTFGSFVDSALTWYPYSGDPEAIRTVGAMLHYAIRTTYEASSGRWPPSPTSLLMARVIYWVRLRWFNWSTTAMIRSPIGPSTRTRPKYSA
jgi:hypothetical protein